MLMGAGVFAVFAVLGLVHLIRNYPRGINAAQEEFRDGDYPTIAYIAPFIPIAAPLVMAPLSAAGLLPEVELAPPVAGMLSGAWWAFGLPLGIWSMFSQSFRIGRRRINKILEKDPLDGVTEARWEKRRESPWLSGPLLREQHCASGVLSALLGEESMHTV